jgi:hypothetical protein
MSKKAKLKKNLDPFTSANDIEKGLQLDKKKSKRTPQEKNRRDRHLQKEIVRQLTDELIKLSDKDMLEESTREKNPNFKGNEVIYTIRPVDAED